MQSEIKELISDLESLMEKLTDTWQQTTAQDEIVKPLTEAMDSLLRALEIASRIEDL